MSERHGTPEGQGRRDLLNAWFGPGWGFSGPHGSRCAPLDTGDRYTLTYAAAGTYPYFCGLHPHMTCTVVGR